MGHIHADYDVIAKMAKSDLDEPVVMLNLLKYRDQAESGHGVDGLTGRQAYTKYGQAFAELEPRFGGSVMWMGRGKHTVPQHSLTPESSRAPNSFPNSDRTHMYQVRVPSRCR